MTPRISKLFGAFGCLMVLALTPANAASDKIKQMALPPLAQGCDSGSLEHCAELSYRMIYGERGAKQDIDRGIALASVTCEGATDEHAGRACAIWGAAYVTGVRQPVDPAKAAPKFYKACEYGNGLGCFNAGVVWERGWLGRQDIPTAMSYYTKGCALDEGRACSNLGNLTSLKSYDRLNNTGNETLEDTGYDAVHPATSVKITEALYYYGKACNLGTEQSYRGFFHLFPYRGAPYSTYEMFGAFDCAKSACEAGHDSFCNYAELRSAFVQETQQRYSVPFVNTGGLVTFPGSPQQSYRDRVYQDHMLRASIGFPPRPEW